MTPARGDLEGEPRLVLADDLGEVRTAAGRGRGLGVGTPPRAAARPGRRRHTSPTRVARSGAAWTGRCSTSTASAAFSTGTTTSGTPCRAAARTAGSTPRTGRTRPSSPSSPRWTTPSAATAGRTGPAAARMATAMARSKHRPLLGDRRRREVDRHPVRRDRHTPRRGAAERTRSGAWAQAASGSPVTVTWGSPGAMWASTSTIAPSIPCRATARVRPRLMTRPRRCAGRIAGPRRAASTPMTSIRTDPDRGVVGVQPGGSQPAQPDELGPGHRLDRHAEARAAPRLHLADDEAVAVEGDDVDLAGVAPPVAGEDRHPALAQEAGRRAPRRSRRASRRRSRRRGPAGRRAAVACPTGGRVWAVAF